MYNFVQTARVYISACSFISLVWMLACYWWSSELNMCIRLFVKLCLTFHSAQVCVCFRACAGSHAVQHASVCLTTDIIYIHVICWNDCPFFLSVLGASQRRPLTSTGTFTVAPLSLQARFQIGLIVLHVCVLWWVSDGVFAGFRAQGSWRWSVQETAVKEAWWSPWFVESSRTLASMMEGKDLINFVCAYSNCH